MLTIITPIYCTSKTNPVYERVCWFINNAYQSKEIHRIIIDFGSHEHIANEFKRLSHNANIQYLALRHYGEPFSSGICRNIGASLARTEFISFQDIDLFAPDYIYERILKRLENFNYYNEIESVPCLYLNEQYSEQYLLSLKSNDTDIHSDVYQLYLEKTPDISMYAPVTSMILTRKAYFMESGGNNLEFYGHGYEDFEALNRLANMSNKFMRSRDYYSHSYKYDSPYYNGYRTYFSLFGRQLMEEKLFFVHLWHPINNDHNYTQRNHINRILFEKLIRVFDRNNHLPEVLTNISSKNAPKTLILAPKTGKTANSIRVALPYLGNCIYAKDDEFKTPKEFNNYILDNNVNCVLFFNAYGNQHRLNLYKKCIKNRIKNINFDRGALPDSWFFDENGFNFSSSSYHPNQWDINLSEEELINAREYIQSTLVSDETLEENGNRIGNYLFEKRYNLYGKKILFIPLQRPLDSVIKYFSDRVESIEYFIESINSLAAKLLSKNWVIIIKQHPLEPKLEDNYFINNKNIVVLNKKDNFKDAISISDAVFTINSGVGLYSLMFGKPTFNIGHAFYCHKGLSNKIDTVNELNDYLDKLTQYYPDSRKVDAFISYLINKFYSFGKTIYTENIDIKTGRSTRHARHIDFTTLRMPHIPTVNIIRRTTPFKINSVYYDYYRSGIQLRDVISKLTPPKQDPQQIKKSQEEINTITQQTTVTLTPNKKKLRKLKSNPSAFFRDAFKNIIYKLEKK